MLLLTPEALVKIPRGSFFFLHAAGAIEKQSMRDPASCGTVKSGSVAGQFSGQLTFASIALHSAFDSRRLHQRLSRSAGVHGTVQILSYHRSFVARRRMACAKRAARRSMSAMSSEKCSHTSVAAQATFTSCFTSASIMRGRS